MGVFDVKNQNQCGICLQIIPRNVPSSINKINHNLNVETPMVGCNRLIENKKIIDQSIDRLIDE